MRRHPARQARSEPGREGNRRLRAGAAIRCRSLIARHASRTGANPALPIETAGRRQQGVPRTGRSGPAWPGAPAGPHARARRRARAPAICRDEGEASEPAGRVLTRCSRMAMWQEVNRRRCATSQLSKCGQRSSSSPSRKSPANRSDSACSRSGAECLYSCRAAAAISTASTETPSRRSPTVSPCVSILLTSGSSRTPRSLLRHQRSSPRGSFGTSHRSSHRRLRPTACGVSAR